MYMARGLEKDLIFADCGFISRNSFTTFSKLVRLILSEIVVSKSLQELFVVKRFVDVYFFCS